MERFAPLTGVLFLLFAIIAFALGGDPPDYDSPQLELVGFWKDDESNQKLSAAFAAWAAFLLVWFGASVRDAIARAEPGPSRLASISFGGSVIAAAGILILAGITFAAASSAGDVSADVTQTLTVLTIDLFFPIAGGLGLFLIAAGLAAIRYGAFDRWLGWIALVIGIMCITPAGIVGFLASLAWVALAGVVLYRKKDPVGSGAAPPPRSGPQIEVPPGAGPPSPS